MDRNNVTPKSPISSAVNFEEQSIASSFTTLSDFTNFHLQKFGGESSSVPRLNIANSPFAIPKLTSKLSTPQSKNTELTPHELSLKKIMGLKNIHFTEKITNESTSSPPTKSPPPFSADFVIDLSTALRTTNSIPIQIAIDRSANDENNSFIPNYIDCDQAMPQSILMHTITKDCEIDISSISRAMHRTKSSSKFGKILCSRYRCTSVPYVKHEFNIRHKIERYTFQNPSPDDLILRQLNKWKRN